MCSGDDHNCPEFELHRKKLLDDLDHERRSFLKSAFVAGGGAAAWAASGTLAGASTHQEKMKVCRKPPRRALAKIASAAFASGVPQRWPTRPPPRRCGAPVSCCASSRSICSTVAKPFRDLGKAEGMLQW